MDASKNIHGSVEEILAGGLYRVMLDTGKSVLAYESGKMKINRIRILVGDRVEVVLDPYGGKATNRIVRRK